MGIEQVNFGPLFGHQYSHIWLDFKGIQDPYMTNKGFDYFENSKRATLTNRLYCIANPKGFKDYDENIWGLTACDGPGYKETVFNGKETIFQGYSARGAATDEAFDDGTIAPTAAGGSIPFAPKECLNSLKTQWEKYYPNLVGKYGFKDAYNPSFTYGKGNENGWFDTDYLGIDQGPIILQAENYRSELLWKVMRKNPYIVAGLKRAGFKGGWLNDSKIEVPKTINIPTTVKKTRYEAPNPKLLFTKKTYSSLDNNTLNYRFLTPKSEANQKYPLVVFLHGSGERGDNNEAQLQNGVLAFAENNFQEKHPSYILAPQCPVGQKWSDYDLQNDVFWREKPSETSRVLLELIDKMLIENPNIDKNRIYITGLSMGGLGTFDLIMRRPDFFAAAIPVCGGGEPTMANLIKNMPLWVTHGALDQAVPVEYSRNMVNALKAVNGNVKYSEYSTLGHFVWQETYYNPLILEWLFEQKKK
jgi:predicted esterase